MDMTKYLIIILAVLAPFAHSSDFADFVNDFQSDLAPLLTLFGEKVTMQYISQAMGPLDCIALALAPLGIITIMVSAIRVGGPTVLKALVGRAKENIAAAELELMSSTSQEVCELYNGEHIVRCLGSGSVWQYICLFRKGIGNGQVQFKSLQQATDEGLLIETHGKTDKKAEEDARSPQGRKCECKATASATGIAPKQTGMQRIRRRLRGPRETDAETCLSCLEAGLRHTVEQPAEKPATVEKPEEKPATVKQPPEKPPTVIVIYDAVPEAPNISLNLQHIGSQKTIWVAVILGVVVQTAVLAFFCLIQFNPRVQTLLKIKEPPSLYGFCMALVGTVFMAIGMFLCVNVVEKSTSEKVYQPNDQFDMRLYWLQQNQTVNDQVFQSFATFPDRCCTRFLKSRRAGTFQDSALTGNKLQTKTFIGVAFGLLGFISQFLGFRGFHPAAPLAQLGAIGIMTVCRAVVRPGFTKNFGTTKLLHGFEQDWLTQELTQHMAQQLSQSTNDSNKERHGVAPWRIVTGRDVDYRAFGILVAASKESRTSSQAPYSEAQRLLVMREGIYKLAKARTVSSNCASKLAIAMETALGILFPDGPGVQGGLGFRWFIDVMMEGAMQSVWIDLRFHQGDKRGWRVAVEDLHAALSLWMYTARAKEDKESGSEYVENEDGAWLCRDVCEPSLKALGEGNYDIRIQVIQDLKTWTTQSYDALREIQATWRREESLKNESDRRLKPNCARAADSDPRTRLGTRAAEADGSLVDLYASDLLFSFMWSMAKTLRVRLGGEIEVETRHDASGFAAQEMNRLRDTAVTGLINAFRAASCWSEHETCLGVISPLSIMHRLPIHQQWFTTISTTIKDALKSRDPVSIKEAWEQALEWASHRIQVCGDGSTTDRVVAWLLEQFHDFQDAEVGAYEIPPRLERTAIGRAHKPLRDLIRRTRAGGSSSETFLKRMEKLYELQGREMKFVLMETTDKPELPAWFDFTTLHKAAAEGELIDRGELDKQRILVNVQDVCGWTPLHYAVSNKNWQMVKTLLEMGADPELTDLRGYTAAHHACLSGCLKSLENLVRRANMTAQAMNGLRPMHLAAGKGYRGIVAFLLSHQVPGEAKLSTLGDFDGRTAAHWAAAGGYDWVVRFPRADLDVRDHHGLTPLHMAVLAGRRHLTGTLYGQSALGEVRDRRGYPPIILACILAKWDIVQELVDAGAKVDAVDSEGRTALHHMVDKRVDPALVSTLTNGQDPRTIWRLIEMKDKHGRSPEDMAHSIGNEAMIHKLHRVRGGGTWARGGRIQVSGFPHEIPSYVIATPRRDRRWIANPREEEGSDDRPAP